MTAPTIDSEPLALDSEPAGGPRPPRPRWRRWLRIAVRVLLVLVGLAVLYVVVTFVQVWSASRQDHAQHSDAIVVLGAAQYNGQPSPVLQARLDHAFDLWSRGFAPIIVVTGGGQEGDLTTEAKSGYDYLRARGVPDEALRLEVDGTNTWESLAASARILRNEGLDEVLLVSDPYHSYRLVGIAHELGLDAHVSPTDTSPLAGADEFRALVRETAAVSLGRIIGYRRLVHLDDEIDRVRRGGDSG